MEQRLFSKKNFDILKNAYLLMFIKNYLFMSTIFFVTKKSSSKKLLIWVIRV